MVKILEFWKVKLLLTFCYLLYALIYDYYTPAPGGSVILPNLLALLILEALAAATTILPTHDEVQFQLV